MNPSIQQAADRWAAVVRLCYSNLGRITGTAAPTCRSEMLQATLTEYLLSIVLQLKGGR